ncbi:MAG: bifunctional metallophosphatase/5'-nucleotidase [Anaerorhabdus sp.]
MKRKFRILATSDIHGFILPYNTSDKKEGNYSLCKVKKIIDKYRDNNTLVIDNGDLIQGNPLTYYYNQIFKGEISPVTKIANIIGYDYYNLGNHDFNFGIEALNNHLNNVNGKFITNNIKVDNKEVSPLYHLHTFDNGVKVALFGIVTDYLVRWEKKETLDHIEVLDSFKMAKKAVLEIRENEKVDAIIGVYHGGFEKDIESGEPTETITKENRAYKICEELKLDILVSGHQHRSISGKCLNTFVSQTAYMGSEVAMIDFDVDDRAGEVTLIQANSEKSQEVIDAHKDINAKYQDWLDTPLGHTDINLEVEDRFDARLNKHPAISFINQVQLDKTNADFSGVALFNDAVGFKRDITMRDLVSTYVYTNNLFKLEITGSVLKQYLERCAEYFMIENNQIVVNKRFTYPKVAHYNYDMVDGLDYTIDLSKPIGNRITSMIKDGKSIDMSQKYSLVISNYRAGGTSGFGCFADCKVIKEYQEDIVEVLADYILRHSDLKVNHKNNIKITK